MGMTDIIDKIEQLSTIAERKTCVASIDAEIEAIRASNANPLRFVEAPSLRIESLRAVRDKIVARGGIAETPAPNTKEP